MLLIRSRVLLEKLILPCASALSATPELMLLLSTSTCGSCFVNNSTVADSRTRIMIRLLKLPTTVRFGAVADAGFYIGSVWV